VAHLPSPPRRPTGQPAQWPSDGPPGLPLSATAAVSRARTPPPCAASTPVTARAPTPHHSPPPPRLFPFRYDCLHSIMAHHRRRPFPSDARPPRSPFDPIKGRGACPSSRHSSPPPFPHSSSLSALCTGVLTATALTTVARPPHYFPSFGEQTTEFPASHSPSPTLGRCPLAPDR
jgi:hypothetical protein